jgi:hypothetical protein
MNVRSTIVASVVGLCLSSAAPAGLLGLTFLPPPDITVGFMDVAYDAGTGQFSAQGFALEMDDGSPPSKPINTANYNYFLLATVDNAGILTPGGSFLVTGEVTSNSVTYGTVNPLLTGTVHAFGYGDLPTNYDILEIVIELTGGDLAIPAFYGSPGTLIGLDMDANYGGAFSGSFAASFDNLGGNGPGFGTGQTDIKPIPEPATLALLGLGVAAMLVRRSRSTRAVL